MNNFYQIPPARDQPEVNIEIEEDELFEEVFDADPPALVPSQNRRYGYRPRGVILRFRDPPQWTRTIEGKEILKELNYQEYFNRKIDAAYDVTKWAIFKSYSSIVSNFQLTFIFGLLFYLIILYGLLHNSLDNYYFVVTKEL